MARTSRVHKKELPQGMGTAKETEKIYQTALYVRLSVLDSGKKDSDTAETQERLLRQFIEGKPNFSLFSVYLDNGESGVTFTRNGFERMMEDVRAGQVDCIIVKDLSRFGRNYIETGEYLEKIFPFLGVRFIAVNDGIDTADPASVDSLALHLKNLVNDVYARDISAKISSVLHGKQECGEFIGTWAAYGYQKSTEDRHRLVIDEKTAPVVRNIFAWRVQGLSYQEIARRLTGQGVPSPSQYRYAQGVMKNKRFANVPWRIGTIKLITGNEVYLGHTVQGRKQESLAQGQKQKKLPKEEWCIVKNTHEAIVDQFTFDQVQQMNRTRKQQYQEKQGCFGNLGNTENILKGLVYCGNCGRRLVRYRFVRENKRKAPRLHAGYSYICPIHAAFPLQCGFGRIREQELYDAVLEAIRVQVQLAGDMEKMAAESGVRKQLGWKQECLQSQIGQMETELGKIRQYREKLYDDYADGLMGEQDYVYAQERYQEKETKLREQVLELEQSCHSLHKQRPENNPWLKNMLQFRDIGKLTREMAVALIEKITVYQNAALHIDFRFQEDRQKLRECLAERGTEE